MENTVKSPGKIVALSVAALVFLTSGAIYAESTFVAPVASTTHSGDTRLAPLSSTEEDTTISGGSDGTVTPVTIGNGGSTDNGNSVELGSQPSFVSGGSSTTTKTTTSVRSVTSKAFDTPDFVSVSPVSKFSSLSSVSSVPSPLRNAGIASVDVKPAPSNVTPAPAEVTPAEETPAEETPAEETPELIEPPKEEEPTLGEAPKEEAPVTEPAPVEEAPKEQVSEEAAYVSINFSDTTSPEVKAAWTGDFSKIEGFNGDPASSISTVVVDADTRIVKWGAGNYTAEAELSSNDIDKFQSDYTDFLNKVLTEMNNRPVLIEPPVEEAPVEEEAPVVEPAPVEEEAPVTEPAPEPAPVEEEEAPVVEPTPEPAPVEEEPVVEEAPKEQVSEEAAYVTINFSDNTSPEVANAWAGDFSQIAKFEGDPSSSISTVVVDEDTRIVKWSAGNYTAEAELSSNDIDKFQSDYTEFLNKVLAHMA